jgi:hypothetical protein
LDGLDDLLLVEAARAALLSNPERSPLWHRAPMRLRRAYVEGRIDRDEFWRAVRQWVAFEVRGRDAA